MSKTTDESEPLLETGDVARAEGVVTATIRADVFAGRLRVAARTVRGTRLFRPADVEAYRKERAARRQAAQHRRRL
jgi:hypothetical protein